MIKSVIGFLCAVNVRNVVICGNMKLVVVTSHSNDCSYDWLTDTSDSFYYTNQGDCPHVDSINDIADFATTCEAFSLMGMYL
jgi:hypothetical protein